MVLTNPQVSHYHVTDVSTDGRCFHAAQNISVSAEQTYTAAGFKVTDCWRVLAPFRGTEAEVVRYLVF